MKTKESPPTTIENPDLKKTNEITEKEKQRTALYDLLTPYKEKKEILQKEKDTLSQEIEKLTEEIKSNIQERRCEPVVEVKPEPVVEVKPEPVVEVKPEPVVEVKGPSLKEKAEKIIRKLYGKAKSAISYLINDVKETNYGKTTWQKMENLLNKKIEALPNKEKKLILEAMKEDTPLEFESPKVKTNYKDYLKNSIVKLYSGFKISPKIKSIIERNAGKILITTAILTIWTNGESIINAEGANINSLKNKDLLDATKNKIIEIGDLNTYNQLSKNGKRIYLSQMTKHNNENYLIVDKVRASMYVIDKSGKLIGDFPVLLGQTKGEAPNGSDADSDVAVNATTPAGKYKLARSGMDILEEDFNEYGGNVLSILKSGGLAIHVTYPKEKIKRTEALMTETTKDNRMSWGCINIDEKMWIKYIKDNFKGTESIFITTDFPDQNFLDPETGMLENAKNDTSKIENFYMTAEGGKAYVQQQTLKNLEQKTHEDNSLLAMNTIK
jgi:hypothetical protein